MAADWSQLPEDLLQQIYQKLNNQFYQLRFRSVCSPWRSSICKNHLNNLPTKLPSSCSNSNNTSITLSISKRSIFLITPPPNQQTLNPWLIKIGPDSNNQTHLWHPLSRDTQFPLYHPIIIDFNQISVRDLGREFVIGNFPSRRPLYIDCNNSLDPGKVVVCDTWHNGIDRCSLLLTIHGTGELAIFRCGDEQWTLIPSISEFPYTDVCMFNGRPIAVDIFGEVVEVRPDLSLDLVVEHGMYGGKKKVLVESDGELLLLVSGHLSYDYDDSVLDDDGEGIYDGAVQIDVFRLDEKEKKWLHVTDLGNRVLFWGEDCAFSASFIGNGNCVIFSDAVFRSVHSAELGISVFHLDGRCTSPLSDFPCYSNLFWPAPEWVKLNIDNSRVCVLD
ncbi:F-box protein SKIP23-like [Trifolium pratense]|uniref:F-box protein SKIP23-like n=1 Tax=Trifolium pratense TaxID=57577 RepID=UPI001E697179|nr:F-box protein SKIP23-like [Trifolium pratense]